ncbi:MAG: tRNA (N6-threonylcarbamoyladenosine(37)-N6)-methyltransferase TrmO [Lachnospiraceae bacterium]|nr:tRNA (N6-threonylcarbamoyladenosine(37)-N6)-methyltransferase TrmO [Lachnospiraceae bacterium]
MTDDRDNYIEIRPIAHIHSPFPEKFGIPRQSGLAENRAEIHFLPDFRSVDSVRGMEGFDYLWLIWGFSANRRESTFQPTVRPPRLGGNTRMGVFATRSPFRPNGLGLSSVRILSIDLTGEDAPVITVEGADLMDGTPIYDIKPYIPYADAHENTRGGFTDSYSGGSYRLQVVVDDSLWESLDDSEAASISYGQNSLKEASKASVQESPDESPAQTFRKILPELKSVLSEDPRPSYQHDPARIYGMKYEGFNVHFRVEDGTLHIVSAEECP